MNHSKKKPASSRPAPRHSKADSRRQQARQQSSQEQKAASGENVLRKPTKEELREMLIAYPPMG